MADKHQADVDRTGLKEEKIPANFKGEGHEVAFDIEGIPEKLYVGDEVSFVLLAACESGCDLVGDTATLSTISGDEVARAQFVIQDGECAVSEPMTLTMPMTEGEYEYVVHYEPRVLPLPDDGGPAFKNPHEERDLLIVFTVEPHHVTISTWGVTSPVWIDKPIEICVGVSCSKGCALGGQRIDVFDEDDRLVCSGTLRTPEAPRTSLWWAKLTAVAPSEAKLHRWEARFSAVGLDSPHEDAKHKFSFVARVPPERNFKITVIDDKTDKPQRSARVEIKPADGTGKAQFASTGAEGTASIGCAKGKYTLKVTAPSRKAYNETVDLTEGDLEVAIRVQPSGAGSAEQIPMKIVSSAAVAAAVETAAEAAPEAVAAPEPASEQAVEPEVTPVPVVEPEVAAETEPKPAPAAAPVPADDDDDDEEEEEEDDEK